MNANRARPLAAYALVSLACALVLAEGMRGDVGGALSAAPDGPAASPASAATASTVPGTVLHSRPTPTASGTATGLPRLDLPGATSTAGNMSTSSGAGSSGSSAGSGTPGVTLHGSTRPPKGTGAGSTSPSGPSTDKGSPGQGKGKATGKKGKKKGKAQAPATQHNPHGKKPKGRGHGKAVAGGASAISLRWF